MSSKKVLETFFGCNHKKREYLGVKASTYGTTNVLVHRCLDCGKIVENRKIEELTMRPNDWIELMQKIKDGEFEDIHIKPDINILGMKITNIGINMMTVREQYGEELDTDILEFTYKKAKLEYQAVDHFANDPEPTLKKKKSDKKNVKKLFKKKK